MTSPVCCFIGEVNIGKTSLLDKLRDSNVQDKEVGHITQQIGATYFDSTALINLTGNLAKSLDIPGLLVLDTPGHDCFSEMRVIGIKVSHLPILVVDLVKGLQKQSIQCIELLSRHNKQFIIVLNKLDKVPEWKKTSHADLKNALKSQQKHMQKSLKDYANRVIAQMAGLGLNAALYYENPSPKEYISMVPVSALTGEGIADLILLISKLTAFNLKKSVSSDPLYAETHGFIIETRMDERQGIIHYVLLITGTLNRLDRIYLETNEGKIQESTIRQILLPPHKKELKNKIVLTSIENAFGTSSIAIKLDGEDDVLIAPGALFVVKSGRAIMGHMSEQINKYGESYKEIKYEKPGIIVNATCRGMAHAIIASLPNVKISDINIGKISKTSVMKAGNYLGGSLCTKNKIDYLYYKRYTIIIDYNNLYEMYDGDSDNKFYDSEIVQLAKKMDVKIIAGNIVHHLVEKYHNYIDSIKSEIMGLYPGIMQEFRLEIIPKFVFLRRSPLMFGVKVLQGSISEKTVIKAVSPSGEELKLGTTISIQRKNKSITTASQGDEICIRIDDDTSKPEYAKDFDETWGLHPYLSPEELEIKLKYPDLLDLPQ
ncbi:MAG: hypothetical protein Hyperionvirus17_33 [Hyperionvirus sp.]|uniref:Tr-type G domain-containing protein n=1 Tax=Hyperionvirus sp. TaxID=2487770 RepID=A0A3G5AE13_9VIRU|nr:MAG: hypothetical protein Hyperionvirus17_33 [Hyperionvirus sp.]